MIGQFLAVCEKGQKLAPRLTMSGQSRDKSAGEAFCRKRFSSTPMVQEPLLGCYFNNHRSAGPMARRLTTNQEIAGSIPASINVQLLQLKEILFCSSSMLEMMSMCTTLLSLL